MATMLVNLVLILFVVGTLGYVVREDPGNLPRKSYDLDIGNPPLQSYHLILVNPPLQTYDLTYGNPPLQSYDLYSGNQAKRESLGPNHLPQQWHDLVTFVNRKIESMERLLTEKDERIDQLELTIAEQTTEIRQLKQGMTSLKEEVSEKDEAVKGLVTRISDLERIVIFDDIGSKSETRPVTKSQFPRTYNETRPGHDKTSDSRSESNVEKTSTQQLSIQGTSIIKNYSINPSPSEQRIKNDHNRLKNQPTDDDRSSVFMEERSEESQISKYQQNRVVPSSFPAFHVAMSSNQAVTTDTTVIYDHETLDQGDGYNTGTGYYTVPESGTYVITWTSLCGGNNYFQTLLVVNGSVRGSSWTTAEEINDIHQTTAIVVLTLNQGDHVFIRIGHTHALGTMLFRNDIATSTFSGWKIH